MMILYGRIYLFFQDFSSSINRVGELNVISLCMLSELEVMYSWHINDEGSKGRKGTMPPSRVKLITKASNFKIIGCPTFFEDIYRSRICIFIEMGTI